MQKVEVRNFKLQRFGSLCTLMWALVSFALSFQLLDINVALIYEIVFIGIGVLYQVKRSRGNRVVVKDGEVSFYDWEKGLLYSGLWSKTIKTSFKLCDIQLVSYTSLDKLLGETSEPSSSEKGKKTKFSDFNKVKIIYLTDKNGNTHVSNATSFQTLQLGKVLGTLGYNGVKVQTVGV